MIYQRDIEKCGFCTRWKESETKNRERKNQSHWSPKALYSLALSAKGGRRCELVNVQVQLLIIIGRESSQNHELAKRREWSMLSIHIHGQVISESVGGEQGRWCSMSCMHWAHLQWEEVPAASTRANTMMHGPFLNGSVLIRVPLQGEATCLPSTSDEKLFFLLFRPVWLCKGASNHPYPVRMMIKREFWV